MAIIAIDFDGTIVEHEFPMIGALKEDAKEIIQLLKKEGHQIIIWTCRTSQNVFEKLEGAKPTIFDVEKFLNENEIPFDTINHNVPGLGFCPYPKVYADFYIDDRNLGGFIPWKEAYDLLTIQIEASTEDDSTIRILIRSLDHLGFGGLRMLNLYALISSKPKALFEVSDAIGSNDQWIQTTAYGVQEIIFCWGDFKGIEYRARKMAELFPDAKCFAHNRNGSPMHPMSIMWQGIAKEELKLIPFRK